MEKTLRLVHGDMRAIEPPIRRFTTQDYKLEDFRPSANSQLDVWRMKRLSEYLELGFPMWKRANFKRIELPPVGRYRGLEDIDGTGLELLDHLDFEGSDRKFVLLADVFSESGTYKVITDDQVVVLSDQSKYDSALFVVESGTLELVRVVEKDFFIGNLRVLVKPGAEVRMYNLYIGTEAFNGMMVANTFVEAHRGARLYVRDLYHGGKLNVGYFGLRIVGEGVRADVRPRYLVSGTSTVDVLYLARFSSGGSYVNVEGRGVVLDTSKLVFRGIMDIRSGCKGAEVHQSNHAILASSGAKVEAIPSLLVDEHEVVASHSASSAPVDENLLFYIMTRGIPYDEAKRMILEGVFAELVGELNRYELGGKVADVLRRVVERGVGEDKR